MKRPDGWLAWTIAGLVTVAACCWALMAIQLALGVMSLPLMAAVAIVIFLEKCWKHGEALAIVIGIAAIVWGALLVLRAAS